MYRDITEIPQLKKVWETEYDYMRRVWYQGGKSDNSTLKEVALHRMRKLFDEIENQGFSFTDLNLEELTFFRPLCYSDKPK